ncbi:MAG: cation transporter, partial [Halobacteria archaeon]|nr:cation transporter [Halobacteria archaeon]
MSSDAECDLCGLPTPDSPPRDSGNVFCCEGCREVYRSFGELDPEEIRSEREEESQVVSDDAETAFLRVDGMHCSTCEKFIESEAEKVDGVENAEASYSSELLKVAYDPSKASTDDVADVIGSLGYSTRDPEEDTTEGSTVSELITPFRLLIGVQLGMMVMIW